MDAEVVCVKNTENDRMYLSLIKDSLSSLRAVIAGKTEKSLSNVFGNYVVLKHNTIYILLAHLKKDSIRVYEGQQIKCGDALAQVGHNGSSLFPHLHIHAMNHVDPNQAQAVNLTFNLLTKSGSGKWLVTSIQPYAQKMHFDKSTKTMNKAYISPILSLMFFCLYLLGYQLNMSHRFGLIEQLSYVSGLIWFVYMNWLIGLAHCIIAVYFRFKGNRSSKAVLIAGLIVLVFQISFYCLFENGIGLSA